MSFASSSTSKAQAVDKADSQDDFKPAPKVRKPALSVPAKSKTCAANTTGQKRSTRSSKSIANDVSDTSKENGAVTMVPKTKISLKNSSFVDDHQKLSVSAKDDAAQSKKVNRSLPPRPVGRKRKSKAPASELDKGT